MPFTLRAALWLLPFALYAASPFVTAWTLKEAITGGNVAVIDALVEWGSVRVTLRKSLTSAAFDRPMEFRLAPTSSVAAGPVGPGPVAPGPVASGWWERFKTYVGTAAVDRLVDRYANAEGLPTLVAYGQAYKRYVASVEDTPRTLATLPRRVSAFWSRLLHVEFVTPIAFEIEMADKFDPMRRFTGLFEFRELRWKLTELYVHSARHPLPRLATLMAARDPNER